MCFQVFSSSCSMSGLICNGLHLLLRQTSVSNVETRLPLADNPTKSYKTIKIYQNSTILQILVHVKTIYRQKLEQSIDIFIAIV